VGSSAKKSLPTYVEGSFTRLNESQTNVTLPGYAKDAHGFQMVVGTDLELGLLNGVGEKGKGGDCGQA